MCFAEVGRHVSLRPAGLQTKQTRRPSALVTRLLHFCTKQRHVQNGSRRRTDAPGAEIDRKDVNGARVEKDGNERTSRTELMLM